VLPGIRKRDTQREFNVNTNIFSDLFRGGLNLTMSRHASAVLWLFLAFLPTQVLASHSMTINTVTPDPAGPGAPVVVNVTVTWPGGGTSWVSTGWVFVAANAPEPVIPGSHICSPTGGSKNVATNINITAPLVPGNYDLWMYADNSEGCIDGHGDNHVLYEDFVVNAPPANTPPVATDDDFTVDEDNPLGGNVITDDNGSGPDSDADGDTPLVIENSTDVSNGTLVLNPNGSFTYDPDPNFCGVDGFSYSIIEAAPITPPAAESNVATVTIVVTCVDDAPVAVNDSATLTEDDPATTIDVLANDTDIDGGPIAIDAVTQPANGEVVITNGGADLTYEPDADYCNDGSPTDDFTYTLAPGGSTATVAVSVTCVDDPPVAVDDSATVTEDDPATAIDVLANDTDVDGGPIAIDSVTQPANGTVVITGGGTGLTYQPDADYCNDGSPTDDFTYTLTPAGPTPTATVAMTVTCVNDAPVMVSVSASSQTADYSDFIGTVTITATDIDSTSLTLSQTGAPSALPNPGLNLTADCTVVPNPSSMDGSTCQWTMDGQVLTPGTNLHNIDFTANDGDLDSTCSGVTGVCRHELTVQPEDADVMLDDDNDVAIQVATAGGTSGTFSLFFSAWETTDPEDFAHDGAAQFGNLNNMTPKMRLTPVGPGGPVDGVCGFVAPLPVYPGEGYGQVALFECVFNAVPVNVYEILATVDNGATASYYQGFDEDMVTIFDPSLGFTTGGGWFYWPDTAITDENDPCFPYAGDKTNFGWNMKYNKKRTNLQGSLLLMRHTLDEFCEEAQYRVKSNALDNMALGTAEDASGPYGWTIFGGKATWREPGADTVGNHRFLVYAEDHGDQGCNQDPSDEFWIEVTDPDGVVLLLLNGSMPAAADPADDGDDEPIACGNIFVPHTRGPN
jgi:VCBS repeat-containing protein